MKSMICLMLLMSVCFVHAQDQKEQIAASIRGKLNPQPPTMEMFLEALDASPRHVPYAGFSFSTQGNLMHVDSAKIKCEFFPKGADVVTLVDVSPSRQYPIYWSIKCNSDGTLTVHGDDGKAIRDNYGNGPVLIPMGTNGVAMDATIDNIDALKSVRKLVLAYRSYFPHTN